MALLDVSSILLDPDFVDSFDVIRRAQSFDLHGRSILSNQTFGKVFGVVTANSPSDLERREDYQNMTRSISVVCQFHLRGETTGFTPDIIVWRGSNYLVKHVDAYPQFGAGFFQAEASSMNKTDPAFEAAVTGRLVYNQPLNAVNLVIRG